MLAAPRKTLISALVAAAGLATIAIAPAAMADAASTQAADARAAAAALIAGPNDRDRTARSDADPAANTTMREPTAGGSDTEANPFNAGGQEEMRSPATPTAGTDNAQPAATKARKTKRRVRRRARRRY